MPSSPTTPQTHTPSVGRRQLKRLAGYARPARWYLVGGFVSALVFGVTSGVGLPVMLKVIVPIAFNRQSEISPKVIEVAQRLFGEDYVPKLLVTAYLVLPLIFLLRGLAAFANRYLVNKAGFIVLENVRVAVFTRLQQLPLAFHHQHNSGDLTARLMADTEQLKSAVVNVSADIIKQPLTLIAAVGTLVFYSVVDRSALFVLVALLSIPLCVLPIQIAARRLKKRARQLAKAGGQLTSIITESMQAPLEIRAYNLQSQQITRFTKHIRGIFRVSMKSVFYQSIGTPAIEFVSACGFVVALYLGKKSGITEATFIALGGALYMCYEPMKKLSGFQGLFKTGGAALERLEEVLDAVDTVPAPHNPKAFPTGPTALEFNAASFRYPARGDATASSAARGGDEGPALADITVRIEPGEIVALVGATGAGKSTFAALIPRFYDPTAGSVTLGGVDLRELDPTALRQHIAVVPQMPTLFNATIAENIRMGRADATEAEVRSAAARAFIGDFIESLPQGYDTPVGERGTGLSGGQRQRVAIARAFLKDAPILIMDEATSALDPDTEAKIKLALKALVQNRMTFMIAHRFSSITLATRILVFEHGRITGDGTAETLVRTHPVYRRMSELQKLD